MHRVGSPVILRAPHDTRIAELQSCSEPVSSTLVTRGDVIIDFPGNI
jgi:hypothetical protein